MQTFDQSADRRKVDLPLGTQFEVTLPEQSGTGFHWTIMSDHKPQKDYAESSTQPGAKALRHFLFTADRAGDSTLRFELRRPWERNLPAAETFTLQLVVH